MWNSPSTTTLPFMASRETVSPPKEVNVKFGARSPTLKNPAAVCLHRGERQQRQQRQDQKSFHDDSSSGLGHASGLMTRNVPTLGVRPHILTRQKFWEQLAGCVSEKDTRRPSDDGENHASPFSVTGILEPLDNESSQPCGRRPSRRKTMQGLKYPMEQAQPFL